MLVLFLAVLLLVVAPGLLLGLGRAIETATDGRPRRSAARIASASAVGGEWYRRKMRPAFTWAEEEDAEPHSPL